VELLAAPQVAEILIPQQSVAVAYSGGLAVEITSKNLTGCENTPLTSSLF
jgi:hypothetical protein